MTATLLEMQAASEVRRAIKRARELLGAIPQGKGPASEAISGAIESLQVAERWADAIEDHTMESRLAMGLAR